MRYAGFWPRLGAMLVDTMVMVPLIGLSFWGASTSQTSAMIVEIVITPLYALYNIYFVGRWGQTIGKMALRIRVVALDGSKAGFRRALYRHSVDLGFSIVAMAANVYALSSIPGTTYDPLSFEGKMQLLEAHTPWWNSPVQILSILWVASELVVLLLNAKRRALHDFIAGTVVVHRPET